MRTWLFAVTLCAALPAFAEDEDQALVEKVAVRNRLFTADGRFELGATAGFAMLSRLQASGKIERALYGKKGEVNGVMLDDGTVVRFQPQAAQAAHVEDRVEHVVVDEHLSLGDRDHLALRAAVVGVAGGAGVEGSDSR